MVISRSGIIEDSAHKASWVDAEVASFVPTRTADEHINYFSTLQDIFVSTYSLFKSGVRLHQTVRDNRSPLSPDGDMPYANRAYKYENSGALQSNAALTRGNLWNSTVETAGKRRQTAYDACKNAYLCIDRATVTAGIHTYHYGDLVLFPLSGKIGLNMDVQTNAMRYTMLCLPLLCVRCIMETLREHAL